MSHGPNDTNIVEELDSLHREICAKQRSFLALVAEADRTEAWRGQGARDLAHWLSIRYGFSWWKAHRWVAAARAIEALPRLSRALETGELRIDKVVELARFVTPETEGRLVRWAKGVSSGRVRRVADLAVRRDAGEAADPEAGRFLSWWFFDEGRRFGLEAELPAAQGAIVQRALERLTAEVPVMPDEDDPDPRLNVHAAGPTPWWPCAQGGFDGRWTSIAPPSWCTRRWMRSPQTTAVARSRVGSHPGDHGQAPALQRSEPVRVRGLRREPGSAGTPDP